MDHEKLDSKKSEHFKVKKKQHDELNLSPETELDDISENDDELDQISTEQNNESNMGPKPYDDDLFIEPAGDYDIVYGDYNSTMDDSSGKRPYIRMTSQLPNVTRSLGGEIRLKCEAVGSPLPIEFIWLKNNAPVEKNKRTKIRTKEHFSKLIISELEVLDSGYYQCTASNVAGSVNSTAVLRVNTQSKSASTHTSKPKKPHRPALEDEAEDYNTYDTSEEMVDRGRLPSDEDADLFRVPNNAAGPGYIPIHSVGGGSDRWLDGLSLRKGDCILYQGDACRNFLSGKHIMVTNESREALYDIDRELRAAVMFIHNIRDLSTECKSYSHAVACYHMYKICDQSSPSTSSNKVISLCRKDCDSLKNEVCPKGFTMAAQHELVGDGPKALLPHCSSLSPNANRCLRVLEPVQPPPPIQPKASEKLPHWCYVDSGMKYEGFISDAVSGRTCLPWNQVGDETYNVVRFPKLSKSRNYCRNPDGKMESPWCFTKPNGQRELCDVPKCPKNMYPELADNYNNNQPNGLIDSLNNTWTNLSNQWQLALMGGIVGISLLLLILLICCCCKKRKTNSSTTSSIKKINGYPIQSCNGSSITTSATNYGRKYQQNLGNGGYEMNSLLPQSIPPTMGYIQSGGYLQQYSPPTTEPPVEPFHMNEILPQQLKLDKVLGEGEFTLAYVGELITERGLTPISVKSLKPGFSQIEMRTFEDEIKSLYSLDHQNIIRMLGISYLDGQQLSAVFDYDIHGDLHEFLKVRELSNSENDEKEKLRNFEDFFRISGQIAAGMDYLSRMGHVHRDLATRNCLVGDQQIVKIADFASLQRQYDRDYYHIASRSRVPLRWLSKEALHESRYSSASDVYAFGVTLWEIYTYGRQPYSEFSNQEVIKMIGMHDLLPSPPNCPSNIYSVMIECWNETSERRPTFGELHTKFQKWCLAGPSQFFITTNRANSSHSGGSNGRRQGSSNPSLTRNFINDPYSVPPPAPVHSTPIGR